MYHVFKWREQSEGLTDWADLPYLGNVYDVNHR